MDYTNFKYGKGPPKHSKRAKNNPKPTANDVCGICSKPYAHLHEVYYGRGKRQLSIQYGMQVRLCQEHHQGKYGVHKNRLFDLQLKREYQEIFEKKYSRELFRQLFGKSYLEGEVA